MKIRVRIEEIVRQMSLSIAILSGFAAYDIEKGNWIGVWIILGTLIFLILVSWLIVNTLMEWNKKKKRRL